MKKMAFKRFVIIALLGSAVATAEPSVYGFGDSGSEMDDSLTSSESGMLDDRNAIAALRQEVARQNERIDGLISIIEGLSASLNELRAGGMNGQMSMGGSGDETALRDLAVMVEKINATYVSKDELQRILGKEMNYQAPSLQPRQPEQAPVPEENLEGQEAATLFTEGVRLFGNSRYDEAKKRFIITDKKGYKSAASNYYLGEIAYYTKQYEDAIFHYKKSAGLYDQASYIDTLLLHTGISLENIGDKAQAKAFYENIIANYPGKKTAEIAKQRLQKL